MDTFEKGENKKGEIVWVASSTMDWGNKHYRKYVIAHNGQHYCENKYDPGDLQPWLLARKLLEEGSCPVYYTQETFPKGEVWLRTLAAKWLVIGVTRNKIETKNDAWPYPALHLYEISTDGRRTWRKAVPESE